MARWQSPFPLAAEYISDPVSEKVPALATLAVTIRFTELPKPQTGHPGSRATSYFAAGDQLSAVELRGASTVDHWYYLSGIDVEPARPSVAVAIVGDSIVDGHGVVSNTNTRWTDFLAERLKGAAPQVAVLNLGIGSNASQNPASDPAPSPGLGATCLSEAPFDTSSSSKA